MGECRAMTEAETTSEKEHDWCSGALEKERPEPATGGSGGGLSCNTFDLTEPARADPAPVDADDDDDEAELAFVPAVRRPAALRYRHREERRRVLRLATEKLAALEENERCLRWEKDLRQQTLLTSMATRLEAEAKAERTARANRARAGRSYSRTLGRTFGSDSCERRRGRRRPSPEAGGGADGAAAVGDGTTRLLEVDVQEMFSDIYNQPAPVLIGPLDQDDEELLLKRPAELQLMSPPAKRPRLGAENTDPNRRPASGGEAPQEQVRFSDDPPQHCAAAAAGFGDFQQMFHHLVPSLES